MITLRDNLNIVPMLGPVVYIKNERLQRSKFLQLANQAAHILDLSASLARWGFLFFHIGQINSLKTME